MNQYIFRIHPTRPDMDSAGLYPREKRLVHEHFHYLHTLMLQGTLLLAGRTRNVTSDGFGLVVYQAQDDEEAAAIMAGDPAIREGVFHGHWYPFQVASTIWDHDADLI